MAKKPFRLALASVALLAVLAGGLYALLIFEGGSAREDAPPLEAMVAQWLLHYTVPANFRAMTNPLDMVAGGADVDAGREVYLKKCEICHAYDGAGKTENANNRNENG